MYDGKILSSQNINDIIQSFFETLSLEDFIKKNTKKYHVNNVELEIIWQFLDRMSDYILERKDDQILP